MSTRIDAGWETLISQASTVIDDFLDEAITRIDNKFGKGFAKKNPGLVGDIVKSTSIVYAGDTNAVGSQWIADSNIEISSKIDSVADAVYDLTQ